MSTTYTLDAPTVENYTPVVIDPATGDAYLINWYGAISKVAADGTFTATWCDLSLGGTYGGQGFCEGVITGGALFVCRIGGGQVAKIPLATGTPELWYDWGGSVGFRRIATDGSSLFMKPTSGYGDIVMQSVVSDPAGTRQWLTMNDGGNGNLLAASDGTLYHGMAAWDAIARRTPAGTINASWASVTNAYNLVEADASGNVLLTNGYNTLHVNSSGTITDTWSAVADPYGAGRSVNGGPLYVGQWSSDNIYRLDLATGTATLLGATGFSNTDRVVVGPDRVVWAVYIQPYQPIKVVRFTEDYTPVGASYVDAEGGVAYTVTLEATPDVAYMAGPLVASSTLRHLMLAGVFGAGRAAGAPATLEVGLTTTVPGTLTNGTIVGVTEPTAASYSRVNLTNGTGMSVSGNAAANTVDVVFPEAESGGWGTVVGVFITDGAGHVLHCAEVTPTVIGSHAVVTIPVGGLTVGLPVSG